MPTIDELLTISNNSESSDSLCSENTESTSYPERENIMSRFNDLLNEIKQTFEAMSAQNTDKNQKRKESKDNTIKASIPFNLGDKVVNINPDCIHYGSKGKVCGFDKLPDEMGDIVFYETTNTGKNWAVGETLKKTVNQLSLDYEDDEEMNQYYLIQNDNEYNNETEEYDEDINEYKEQYYSMSVGSLRAIMNHAKDILDYLDNPMVKENLTAPHLQGMIAVAEDHMRSIHDFVMFVETDDDDYEETESEVKPIDGINKKRKKVKISDLPHYEYQYKKYPGVTTTLGKNNSPGLWENIRKKKERMGKNYKPAKPGDKDRPDSEQWKKLTK